MKKNLLLILFSATILIIAGRDLFAQEYQSWKYTHPKPQANLLRKIQMITESTWITAGGNGTFMKTTDAGTTWFFHHKAGRHSNAAKSIGTNVNLWFFDANKGFVIGETGYIGKTSDGGVTFDSVGIGAIPTNEMGQGIWFANQDTGYVTSRSLSWSNGSIARTTNGGATWSNVQTAQGITSVWGTSSLIAYAIAVDGTVLKTTNAGQTWTQYPAVAPQFMYGIGFVNETTGFLVGSQGQISRTTNSGVTWAPLTTPQVDWAFFQIKIVSASEIYAVGDPAFLYKSTDLGNSWQTINIMPVSGPHTTFVWYSLDKTGNTMTLSGDYGVIARSTDNGINWIANHFSLNSNLVFDLKQVPGTTNLIAVGRQSNTGVRQIYRSTNYGNNWNIQDLGINMNVSAICMVNSLTGYISGTDAKVLKTTDGGITWFEVTQPIAGSYDLYSLDFVNPDTGWVFVNYTTVGGGNIFKTTNGGTTWTQQTNNLAASISSADMIDANTGYHTINSTNRPIYKTTDGGSNWFSVTTPLTGQIKSVKAIDAQNLFIGAGSGTTRMAKSTDGGTTWTPITLPIPVDITSIDFMDADTGYVCGNTTTVVCRTTNGGSSWIFENLHLPTLLKVVVLNNDMAFALGTYGSIMRFDPHGIVPVELTSFTGSVSGNNVTLKWNTSTELNNQGFNVERRSSSNQWENRGFVSGNGTTTASNSYSFTDNELAPGNYSYRLKQIDFDGTFAYSDEINIQVTAPFNFALEQNYPNPFNPSTTIRYTVPQSSLVTVKVMNIIGQEVVELVNEVKTTGQYEINFESNGLASGIYIVKMQAGDFTSTIKMTLIK